MTHSKLPTIAENLMKTTHKSLMLASTVLGFDIIELWSDEGDGLNCTYRYIDQDFTNEYPTVISGPSPSRGKGVQSQFLCGLAKESIEDRCFWLTGEVIKDNLGEDYRIELAKDLIPFQTQFAYLLKKVDEEGGAAEVFVVGYSLDKVECKPTFLKFLSGLGYAIYVAAFDIDENVEENVDGITATITDFAVKDKNYEYRFDDSTHSKYSLSSSVHSESYAEAFKHSVNAKANAEQHHKAHTTAPETTEAAAPAAAPVLRDYFAFDYQNITVKANLKLNLALSNFKNVKHIADGTNANIFTANMFDANGDFVVIKMLKEGCAEDEIALNELDVEIALLSRMDHPNIIKVIGGGSVPRKFIVMECLGGGSLHSVMAANPQKPGLAAKLFKKHTWTFDEILVIARDLALALDYLHYHCHPGACILHRDLKPENIGLTKEGKLKLFDFGLSSCVNAFEKATDKYEMTGYTGSLRYMAPEVVQETPYNEKVDVYSYSIVLWQIAKDRVPFKGLNAAQFTEQVVGQGLRPVCSPKWPPAFSNLLQQCWDKDPLKRPSLAHCAQELNKIINSRKR